MGAHYFLLRLFTTFKPFGHMVLTHLGLQALWYERAKTEDS